MVSPKLILLVDDDDDDRFLFQQAVSLVSEGSSLMIAANGKEALDILAEALVLPDILFMDINMPVMNGIDCLRAIKGDAAFSHLHIVMISTAANEDMQEEMLNTGARAFSRKPVAFNDLSDMIASHLQSIEIAIG